MGVRFFIFLSLFFCFKALSNPFLLSPNLNTIPIPLSAGTTVMPLCSQPQDPFCVQQWSLMALPMAVYNDPPYPSIYPTIPEYQPYIPIILPRTLPSSRNTAKNPIGNPKWRTFRSSFLDSKPHRVYYKSKSNPRNVRVVETNPQTGEQRIYSLSHLPGVLEQLESPVGHEDWELDLHRSGVDEGFIQAIYLQNDDPSSTIVVKTDKASGDQEIIEGTVLYADSAHVKRAEDGLHRISQDTQSFPAKNWEDTDKGSCFKPGSGEQETEAGFCFDCVRSSEEPVLSLIEDQNFVNSLKTWLNKSADKTERVLRGKLAGVKTSEGGTNFAKICMFNQPLKSIIDHFNNSCGMDFNKFFNKAYCDSCRQAVPPEIMFAMMSIESAGACSAEADNANENSFGLFQVNANTHGCTDSKGQTYSKKTRANKNCLTDPNNNLNASIKIFKRSYNYVNPKKLPPQASQCQTWSEKDNKEKDRWRKAVAGYNAGEGWIIRAIKSVNVSGQDLQAYKSEMVWSHGGDKLKLAQEKYIEQEQKDPSWEQMRLYMFTEKFLQGVSNSDIGCGDSKSKKEGGTGRRLNCSLSNIAHTEAVLGRSADNSYPGMVEVWEQYIKNNKPSCATYGAQ